ncbi:thiosulfate/3-mercaptopyruvate sulfurtransferase [Devosia lucknowensis]|uniref:Thiosulfate/3-mercaptopyruvate sulfurtransferase n=1 Tax=Devosia lucknowensis TaxID=1096929 RepID=A0A1Y6F6A0_9HYPH|nr:sulfurtransferase [Devosia lucknowensis]SMQ70069.1 thiosulfate/3-mercaptopyruvate sulfurtransferase [Devosia lucknowensis]
MRFASIVAAVAIVAVAPVFAQAQDVTPLVTAEWLKAHSADDNVVVIDIRDDIEGTDLGDLPYVAHAVVAPYASYGWRTEVEGVPGQIPPDAQIAELVANLGVNADDHVVIVPWGTDSSEFGGATRVYWTFKYLGHDAVSILDGGWRQYDAQGGERVAEAVTPEKGDFVANVRPELRATTADVEAALASGVKLIDGRPEEQFLGQSKSPVVRVEGTIPGALNIPNGKFYSAEYASFAQPETIAALTEAVGLAQDEENIVFCNTGHWASVVWFALHEVQGNSNTAMYDGSMAEWAADPARPIQ